MTKYRVKLKTHNYDPAQVSEKTFVFEPNEPILVQLYYLTFIPAKELHSLLLTRGVFVVEFTLQAGKIFWEVAGVEKITL